MKNIQNKLPILLILTIFIILTVSQTNSHSAIKSFCIKEITGGRKETRKYDAKGNFLYYCKEYTDGLIGPKYELTHIYNEKGQFIEEIDTKYWPKTNVTQTRKRSLKYNDSGKLVKQIRDVETEEYEYDQNGNNTKYTRFIHDIPVEEHICTYTDKNKLIDVYYKYLKTNETKLYHRSYDNDGNEIEFFEEDQNGNRNRWIKIEYKNRYINKTYSLKNDGNTEWKTTYERDPSGNIIWENCYKNDNGNLIITDRKYHKYDKNGIEVFSKTTDGNNNIIYISELNNYSISYFINSAKVQSKTSYNNSGKVMLKASYDEAGVTTAYTEYFYDEKGNEVKKISKDKYSKSPSIIEHTYDEKSRIKKYFYENVIRKQTIFYKYDQYDNVIYKEDISIIDGKTASTETYYEYIYLNL